MSGTGSVPERSPRSCPPPCRSGARRIRPPPPRLPPADVERTDLPSDRRACARRERAGRRRCRVHLEWHLADAPGRRRCAAGRPARAQTRPDLGERLQRSDLAVRGASSDTSSGPIRRSHAATASAASTRPLRVRPARTVRRERPVRSRASQPCRAPPRARSRSVTRWSPLAPASRAATPPGARDCRLSVAPLVKTISLGSAAPIAAASCSRASSTAASARHPYAVGRGSTAFPKCVAPKYGSHRLAHPLVESGWWRDGRGRCGAGQARVLRRPVGARPAGVRVRQRRTRPHPHEWSWRSGSGS